MWWKFILNLSTVIILFWVQRQCITHTVLSKVFSSSSWSLSSFCSISSSDVDDGVGSTKMVSNTFTKFDLLSVMVEVTLPQSSNWQWIESILSARTSYLLWPISLLQEMAVLQCYRVVGSIQCAVTPKKPLLQDFHTSAVLPTKSTHSKIRFSFGSIVTNTLSKCKVTAFLPGTWVE